jgi:4'-phosphopantetheinyl transferase
MHGWHAVVEKIDLNEIHLWVAHLDVITDQRLLAEYRSLLSEEESQKQARFRFERDRHRYLVTRAMVRRVLSKYAEVEPSEWRFSANEYGKPAIAAELTVARGIDFNMSHTEGLVVLGITRRRMIGVDVENIHDRQVDLRVADRYFSPRERSALRALAPEQQLRRFFEYWTLKESYIKARGLGLSIPLDRFAFDLEDSAQIRLSVDPCLGDIEGRWTCWCVLLAEEQLAAVCVEGEVHEKLRLSSRHFCD